MWSATAHFSHCVNWLQSWIPFLLVLLEEILRRNMVLQLFFFPRLFFLTISRWTKVGRLGAACSPGGRYSIMALNQVLSSWTLFWLGLGHRFLLAAQWWSLIKHGTVLWNLKGMFEGRKEQKGVKRWHGRLAKWECLVETEAEGTLPKKQKNKEWMCSRCNMLYFSVRACQSLIFFKWNYAEDAHLSMWGLIVLLHLVAEAFHWLLTLPFVFLQWISTSHGLRHHTMGWSPKTLTLFCWILLWWPWIKMPPSPMQVWHNSTYWLWTGGWS